MIEIKATVPLTQAPTWALLERQLIKAMEEAVHPFLKKYTQPDGQLIWNRGNRHSRDGADDFYESFYNWPLLYLLGGGDHLLELGQRQWDATTVLMEEYGHVYKEYEIGYDQFHQSESYIYFYLLCMADPQNEKNRERARRFAGFFLNEDPEAQNYDPEKKIIKCAHNGSRGPRWLYEDNDEPSYGYSPGMARYGLPYEDLEGIDSPEDLKDPENARRMGQAMKERMDKGDCATNLHVTPLIANALYLTGDEKYRAWLLEYVDAWIGRAEANGGLLPDNVGLSGEVGEYIDGRWYGSMYGWTWPHGFYNLAMAAILAGTHCYLVTRDEQYLALPRTQIEKVMEQGKMADLGEIHMSLGEHWVGQLTALGDDKVSFVVPYCYGAKGWSDFQPLAAMYPAALWNISGAAVDWEVLEEIRAKERYDWREVIPFHNKEDGYHEPPWFCYLKGENPDYPVAILQAALALVYRRMELVRQDKTEPCDNHIHWWQQLNPVTTEALIQLTLGAPQMLYNGGMLMAPLRYFDAERKRPGLPPDIGALVEKVEEERLVVQLVNLSAVEGRKVLVQAGTLGEHRFTGVEYSVLTSVYPGVVEDYAAPPVEQGKEEIEVNSPHFQIELPPGTEIRLEIGFKRHTNEPSYEFPEM
jgi:hypothetical protein